MSLVIAISGERSKKIINNQLIEVTPFVGADSEGEFAQMGFGFLLTEETESSKGHIWGLLAPHQLIRSWRSMKILERLERIEDGTLCCCFYAAQREISNNDQQYLDRLAEQLGDAKKLQTILTEVMALNPNAVEMETMLNALRRAKVDISEWELQEEIKAGRISNSPLIETIIEEAEARREEHKTQEEEIKKPVAEGESLSAFFRDLGIGNFIVGGGFGGYEIDWGHIDLNALDQTVKRDSFSEYLPNGHKLEHTTEAPETSKAGGAGITVYMTSFGDIESPWFIASDGTKYTFLFAKFKSGYFYVKTKIERNNSCETAIEEEHTVGNLRQMIGSLPEKPKTRFRKIVEKIFG
jgi:hypothetical protein